MWNSAALEALEGDETLGVTLMRDAIRALEGDETLGVGFGLAGASADGSSLGSGVPSSVPSVPRRVLTDPVRLPGTAELSAALEALGTPLEGY